MRIFFIILILLLMPNLSLAADTEQETKEVRGNLSPELETALSQLIQATSQSSPQNLEISTQQILNFLTTNTEDPQQLHPATRDSGAGVFAKGQIKQSIKKIMAYMLNPKVPGEALYPSSVRRNAWVSGSIITNSDKLVTATLPPQDLLSIKGVEYEETTPDTSSGCYYSYELNRLFILTSIQGRTALFSISNLPKPSAIGLRGYIIEPDDNWEYVYTPSEGTNLPLLNWAKTQLYGSSSVTVFLESAPNSKQVDIYMFKWAKAGWSGMNVIKPHHIQAGLERFILGFRTTLESRKLPSPEAIVQEFVKLKSLSAAELVQALQPLSLNLAQKAEKISILKSKDFDIVLENNGYGASLSSKNAQAELIKEYMRKQLGLTSF